jgi:hypothetical protein
VLWYTIVISNTFRIKENCHTLLKDNQLDNIVTSSEDLLLDGEIDVKGNSVNLITLSDEHSNYK